MLRVVDMGWIFLMKFVEDVDNNANGGYFESKRGS